jgi:hypothetical protein
MKKAIGFLIFLLFFVDASSQINIKGNEYTGIDSFNLGDPVQQFNLNLKRVDSMVWEGKLSTTYVYNNAGNQFYEFGGILFNACMFGFDEHNRMAWIQLSRIRTRLDTVPYILSMKLKKEIEGLVALTNKSTGLKAKKKLHYKSKTSQTYIYWWKGEETVIHLNVDYRGKAISGFSYVVRWKRPDDDQEAK